MACVHRQAGAIGKLAVARAWPWRQEFERTSTPAQARGEITPTSQRTDGDGAFFCLTVMEAVGVVATNSADGSLSHWGSMATWVG